MTLSVAAIGWILTGDFLSGIYIGVGVFLTWALSRELDPKYGYSAFLAAAFSLLNLFYYETIQLLIIVWILLLMRIVNGITGKELTNFDIFSVLGLTIYLSFTNTNSVYLLLFILAMALTVKAGEKINEAVIASGISLGLFIAESFFMGYLSVNNINYLDPTNLVVLTLLCLSFVFYWFLSREETEDDKGNRLKKSKLFASQILYSLAVLLLFFLGDLGLNNLIIYISAILGISIYFIGTKMLNRKKSK